MLVYESGTLGSKPEHAAAVDRRRRAGRHRRQRDQRARRSSTTGCSPGRIDVGFLSGAQIDRFANINSTVIGNYADPEGPPAGRRWRAGDRRLLRRGRRPPAPQPPHVRRARRLRARRWASAPAPGCREQWGLARPRSAGRRHRPRRAAPRPVDLRADPHRAAARGHRRAVRDGDRLGPRRRRRRRVDRPADRRRAGGAAQAAGHVACRHAASAATTHERPWRSSAPGRPGSSSPTCSPPAASTASSSSATTATTSNTASAPACSSTRPSSCSASSASPSGSTAQGLAHRGIELAFEGRRHRLDFHELVGHSITVYGQQEIVKDLIAARLAAGDPIVFEASDVTIDDDRRRPPGRALRRRRRASRAALPHRRRLRRLPRREPRRPRRPGSSHEVFERDYPFGWLGILAEAAPTIDELIYAEPRPRLRPVQHALADDHPAVPAGACRRAHRGLVRRPHLVGAGDPPADRRRLLRSTPDRSSSGASRRCAASCSRRCATAAW